MDLNQNIYPYENRYDQFIQEIRKCMYAQMLTSIGSLLLLDLFRIFRFVLSFKVQYKKSWLYVFVDINIGAFSIVRGSE
jgi:hypothetical protein